MKVLVFMFLFVAFLIWLSQHSMGAVVFILAVGAIYAINDCFY